jgi:hypothetical protein
MTQVQEDPSRKRQDLTDLTRTVGFYAGSMETEQSALEWDGSTRR